MGDGKQGAMVIGLPPQQNPITQIQAKLKEIETGFKCWLSKQSLAVEAAVSTATGAAQGAAIGGLMGTLNGATPVPTPPPGSALNPQALASLQQAQVLIFDFESYVFLIFFISKASAFRVLDIGFNLHFLGFICLWIVGRALAGGPLIQARNFAVMTGVNAGLSTVMKRIRGKEDVESSMVAAFGSGAAFSLVSGMGGPNLAMNVVSSGLFFALIQGALFKVGEKFSKNAGPAVDPYYARTGSMLSALGLRQYEKNFKKGLLTDSTLPLLTDSALKDVNIPPGPRLLILDHVQRDPELKSRRV